MSGGGQIVVFTITDKKQKIQNLKSENKALTLLVTSGKCLGLLALLFWVILSALHEFTNLLVLLFYYWACKKDLGFHIMQKQLV